MCIWMSCEGGRSWKRSDGALRRGKLYRLAAADAAAHLEGDRRVRGSALHSTAICHWGNARGVWGAAGLFIVWEGVVSGGSYRVGGGGGGASTTWILRNMGTLSDAFGLHLSTASGDPGGCGIQRTVEHIFSRDVCVLFSYSRYSSIWHFFGLLRCVDALRCGCIAPEESPCGFSCKGQLSAKLMFWRRSKLFIATA